MARLPHLLRRAAGAATLQLRVTPNETCWANYSGESRPTEPIRPEPVSPESGITVTLTRGEGGFGLRFGGPKDRAQAAEKGISGVFLQEPKAGSVAAASRGIKKGLQVLQVTTDGIIAHTANSTQAEFKAMIKDWGDTVTLSLVENEELATAFPSKAKSKKAKSINEQQEVAVAVKLKESGATEENGPSRHSRDLPDSDVNSTATTMVKSPPIVSNNSNSAADQVTEVRVAKDENGFGLRYGGPKNASSAAANGGICGIFLNDSKPGSVAEKTDGVMPGLQIVAINDTDTTHFTRADLKAIVSTFGDTVLLKLKENADLVKLYENETSERGSDHQESDAIQDDALLDTKDSVSGCDVSGAGTTDPKPVGDTIVYDNFGMDLPGAVSYATAAQVSDEEDYTNANEADEEVLGISAESPPPPKPLTDAKKGWAAKSPSQGSRSPVPTGAIEIDMDVGEVWSPVQQSTPEPKLPESRHTSANLPSSSLKPHQLSQLEKLRSIKKKNGSRRGKEGSTSPSEVEGPKRRLSIDKLLTRKPSNSKNSQLKALISKPQEGTFAHLEGTGFAATTNTTPIEDIDNNGNPREISLSSAKEMIEAQIAGERLRPTSPGHSSVRRPSFDFAGLDGIKARTQSLKAKSVAKADKGTRQARPTIGAPTAFRHLQHVGIDDLPNVKGYEGLSANAKLQSRTTASFRTPQAPAEKCATCAKAVYLAERVFADGKAYHKVCFRCSSCDKKVTPSTFAAQKGVLFCKPCFIKLFKLKGNYDEGFGGAQHKKQWEAIVVGATPSKPDAFEARSVSLDASADLEF